MDKRFRRHRRQLKAINSFAGRLAERRRLGGDCEAIAMYAHAMVVNKRTNRYLRLEVDEQSIPGLLTADECAVYQRLVAAEWARTQRRVLAAKAASEDSEKAIAESRRRLAALEEIKREDAVIRQRLLAVGAVGIGEVARRLGVSVRAVRRLRETGQLPSDGYVPIQRSWGRPVHLWFPRTLANYLDRRGQN